MNESILIMSDFSYCYVFTEVFTEDLQYEFAV